jgi:uncharacterized protein (TIGR00661 family)
MAKIFYSMAGEGRGHATRVRAVVEQLRGRHEIVLYAPGDAHSLLAPIYEGTEVAVREISCLRFQYTQKRLNPIATTRDGARYLWRLPKLVNQIRRDVDREGPDLAITDFEPALPRAAKAAGVPFLSLDHQHFLCCCNLDALPASLRMHAWIWGKVVERYYSGQEETVISSFFSAPLRKCVKGPVTQIGVLLQPEMLNVRPRDGKGLVVYLRKFASNALLSALQSIGLPTKVYGLGEHPSQGSLEFRAIDQRRFLDDLAGSEALITTAGNQVVGEALYLGKPVLALPESNNYEQSINAFFLRKMQTGDAADWRRVGKADLTRFLDRLGEFGANIDREAVNGTRKAVAAIERLLPVAGRTPSPQPKLVSA